MVIRNGTGWPYAAPPGVCSRASTTTGPPATAVAGTGTWSLDRGPIRIGWVLSTRRRGVCGSSRTPTSTSWSSSLAIVTGMVPVRLLNVKFPGCTATDVRRSAR
jgi:hypothetical protein